MIERRVPTKTQQVIIDSRYKTSGSSNAYVIDLKGSHGSGNTYSNVFFSNFDSVVGIKVIGVFIKNTSNVVAHSTTGIDFVCPQIPKIAQQLSAPHGYVWCRVPLVRNYDPAAATVLEDQWWEAPHSKTQYFPPTQLSRLEIFMWTNNDPPSLYYNNVENDNYLIVEFTFLDRHSDVLP